jgi:hypothetical protein
MREIPLTQGLFAHVDDNKFEELSIFRWCAVRRPNGRVYAVHNIKTPNGKRLVYMHRQIMGVTDPKILVDHANHDGLDNQTHNLRRSNKKQNGANRKTKRSGYSSRYAGVCWDRANGKWIAQCGGATIGRFASEIEAAKKRDAIAAKLYGEFAALNFPAA